MSTFGPGSVKAKPQKTRRAPVYASLSIKKPLGEPTSRKNRGRHALEGAQTHVSTVKAGVIHRNPTKLY